MENPYVAQAKLKRLCKYLPVACNHLNGEYTPHAFLDTKIEYKPVFRLGSNFKESLSMMQQIEELCSRFPGLDCGSCGAPTCRTLAEDIVKGEASERDCIFVLRKYMDQIPEDLLHQTEEEHET